MKDIYKYISANYHAMQMESKGMYLIDYETLAKEIYSFIFKLNLKKRLKLNEIPELIFINTIERKSKYIVINRNHYILIDLHQIIEYVYGSQIAIALDGDLAFVISASSGCDESEIDINMSKFTYYSNKNVLKAKICNCYNLADLCFSKGYVDAAIKNLCSIATILEDIHSNISGKIISNNFFYEAKFVGAFICGHELVHYSIEHNKYSAYEMKKYHKLLKVIRLRYESGILGKEWKRYSKEYSSSNFIENKKIETLFSELNVNEKYPNLMDELNNNILSWKNLYFRPEDWDLFSEELICDIMALNAIMENNTKNYHILSYIIRTLLIQETFSLQNNLLMYVTGKQKNLYSQNIKRVQLIFSTVVVDYQEKKRNSQWDSIIEYIDYDSPIYEEFLIDICNSVEMIHENFYLVAIQDFCKSLLSEDILHKHLNCAYYLNENDKDFVFTDSYRDKDNIKNYLTNIDAVLLQEHITEEYCKFVDYVFN